MTDKPKYAPTLRLHAHTVNSQPQARYQRHCLALPGVNCVIDGERKTKQAPNVTPSYRACTIFRFSHIFCGNGAWRLRLLQLYICHVF